jgi:hypothetical protein
MQRLALIGVFAILAGCRTDAPIGNTTGFDGDDTGDDDVGDGDGDGDENGDGDGDGDSGLPKLDVGDGDGDGDTGGQESCKIVDDMDGVAPCEEKAPPDSFEPEVQWSWDGDGDLIYSIVTPLVANLTDDNDDGEIDLCDTPDIIVSVSSEDGCCVFDEAYLYALDGQTGAVHWVSEVDVGPTGMTPAVGDLDDDGTVEIVALRKNGHPVVFDHEGMVEWESANYIAGGEGSVALANLDNVGAPEIIVGDSVQDATGAPVFNASLGGVGSYDASLAVDLDDDGDLEVVTCGGAVHHDGTVEWTANIGYGYPQAADFDDDGEVEILCTTSGTITLFEADGTVAYSLNPGGVWNFPAVVHDLDGDGAPEYACGASNVYVAREADGTVMWSNQVNDQSGIAGGTAFDFLGDGVAEAMYADEWNFFVYDGKTGDELLNVERSSGTLIEYPVVADVDNDGSAEAVVVTNYNIDNNWNKIKTAPTVQVVRDKEDRWIRARRIWNQHTYHVTNVREDGTIPEVEPHHWETLNTFRSQAQIAAGGGTCQPEPEG